MDERPGTSLQTGGDPGTSLQTGGDPGTFLQTDGYPSTSLLTGRNPGNSLVGRPRDATVTRFDERDPATRRDLVAHAVRAHRERDSPYLTVETDDGDWIQFSEGVVNMDCTDEELSRLEDLLVEFPDFRTESRSSPDDVEGTNVRLATHAGPDRIAQFVEQTFEVVYGLPEDVRLWAAEI
ncbi:MAG: hypothetical protein V5A23_09710 [Halobacteriales archaeon]